MISILRYFVLYIVNSEFLLDPKKKEIFIHLQVYEKFCGVSVVISSNKHQITLLSSKMEG